jgi:predicted nucleic acid-binding protein
MNVLDSSCWLEYIAGSPLAGMIEPAIDSIGELIVPSITIYEVTKKLLLEKNQDYALTIARQMMQGAVINVDGEMGIYAALIGKDYHLPMADSIIYATALKYQCTLWTTDRHFENLPQVRYFPKGDP